MDIKRNSNNHNQRLLLNHSNSVELVRIGNNEDDDDEQRLFDVEKELGRDVSSVFKTSTTKNGTNASSRFVTAAELEKIREERGLNGRNNVEEDRETMKPLWQVLEENAREKEEKFQEGWRVMKEGKNRPLEEDEIEFLDEIEVLKRENEKRKRVEEDELSKNFLLAKQKLVVVSGGSDDDVEKKVERDDDLLAKVGVVAGKNKKKFIVAKKKKTSETTIETSTKEAGIIGGLLDYSSSSE